MRRYIYEGNISGLKTIKCDVVIIGSGAAGLYAAYNIDQKLKIAVISKESINNTSSYLAQGGIAAAINSNDSPQQHLIDTLKAGAGMCDEEAANVLVYQGPEEIYKLIEENVPFDIDENGQLHTTREGGHTQNRILHCGGDSTGRGLVKSLFNMVSQKDNVTIVENGFFVDVITQGDEVCGAVIFKNGEFIAYNAPNVIVCTGGIGQIYRHTTNPMAATGDGIAAAIRAGAEVNNMEFVQFHPTGLYQENAEGSCFLISEAVRGEGGILINEKGERFLDGVHPMRELAPRDIVAREIFSQLQKSTVPYVYLDISHKPKELILSRFPTIYKKCLNLGIDITKQPIPVCPVQHYFMGGIKTDINAMSTINGLYACGEAACTGVHGANRLASNSLLECIVFSKRCAKHINEQNKATPRLPVTNFTKQEEITLDLKPMRERLKTAMNLYGGIVRSNDDIDKGLSQISEIYRYLEDKHFVSAEQIEAYNMAEVSISILLAARERDESIGAHFIKEDSHD